MTARQSRGGVGRETADGTCGGRASVARLFGAVTLYLRLEAGERDFAVPASVLVEWLREYDRWFKSAVGITDGRNLHLLYGRGVSAAGDGLLRAQNALQLIGTASRECGLGFSIVVDAIALVERERALARLVTARAVDTVGIAADETVPRSVARGVGTAVERLLRRGVRVELVGSCRYYMSIGLLASPILNATNVTVSTGIVPDSYRVPHGPMRSACRGRFRVHVDGDGTLYPCLGLFGEKAASFGTVYEGIGASSFIARKAPVDVVRLALSGPQNQSCDPRGGAGLLPPVCTTHRQSLANAASDLRQGPSHVTRRRGKRRSE